MPRPLRDAIRKRRRKRRHHHHKKKDEEGKDGGELLKPDKFERGADPDPDIDLVKEMEEKGPDYNDFTVYAVPLEKDPYNIIAVSGCTPESFTAFLILFMKGAAVVFLYYDLLLGAADNYGNRFDIPPMVTWPVRGCQFISIPLTCIAHPDARIALYWLSVKFSIPNPEVFPQSNKASWGVSLWWRLLTGLLLAFASFVQINRSVRIRQLFLSIQGTMLIGMMDKVMFWLGQFGFLGKRLQSATKNLENAHILLPERLSCRRYLKSMLLGLMVAIGWIGWGAFVFYQSSGKYLAVSSCSQLSIKFGTNLWESPVNVPVTARYNVTSEDDPNSVTDVTQTLDEFSYSWFTGTYKVGELDENDFSSPFQRLELINGRLTYYEVIDRKFLDGTNDDDDDETPSSDKRAGKFWYCRTLDTQDNEVGQWVFTVDAITDALSRSKEVDDCPGWLLRSKPTDAVRLEDVDPDSWLMWTAKGDVEAVVQDDDGNGLTYTCEECESSVDCHYNGQCVEEEPMSGDGGVLKSFCTCDDGYTGAFCDVPVICRTISASEVFPTSDDDNLEFDPPLSTNTFYQITLQGDKSTQDTKVEDFFQISGHPVYMELEDRFTNLQQAANNAARVRYFWYTSGRWYIGINDASKIMDGLLQRTDIHSFWDQEYLQYVEAAAAEPTSSLSSPETPLDVDEWSRIITDGEGSSAPFDLTLTCADEPPSALPLCDPSYIPYDNILGCPRELTGQPVDGVSTTARMLEADPSRLLQVDGGTAAYGGPENAFDADLQTVATTRGQSDTLGLLILEYPLDVNALSTTVAGYSIYPAQNDFACKDPSSWSVQGCDSGGACIPIDTQVNQTFLSRMEPNEYLLNPYGEGEYASLLFDFSNAGLCNDTVQLAEIQVFGYYGCKTSVIDDDSVGPPFIEPDLGCSSDATALLTAEEGAEALLDNDPTTGVEFDDVTGTVVLDFTLEANAVLSAYSIATSVGPQVCQSPSSWTVFVCSCDDYCAPVDTRERQTLEANVRETYTFADPESLVDAGEIFVTHVKLVATNSNNDPCGIILSDFRLYALSATPESDGCSATVAFAPQTPSPGLDGFAGPPIEDYYYYNYNYGGENSTDDSDGEDYVYCEGIAGNFTGGNITSSNITIGNFTDGNFTVGCNFTGVNDTDADGEDYAYDYGGSDSDGDYNYNYNYGYGDGDGDYSYNYGYGEEKEQKDVTNIFITDNQKPDAPSGSTTENEDSSLVI